uniref:Uncharacterized protein n=1 Tax=Cyanoptyche gloeocystis TaxID=77922 RepID=A0A7S2NQQ4_9EUKA
MDCNLAALLQQDGSGHRPLWHLGNTANVGAETSHLVRLVCCPTRPPSLLISSCNPIDDNKFCRRQPQFLLSGCSSSVPSRCAMPARPLVPSQTIHSQLCTLCCCIEAPGPPPVKSAKRHFAKV